MVSRFKRVQMKAMTSACQMEGATYWYEGCTIVDRRHKLIKQFQTRNRRWYRASSAYVPLSDESDETCLSAVSYSRPSAARVSVGSASVL
jgi:hypothetical protein